MHPDIHCPNPDFARPLPQPPTSIPVGPGGKGPGIDDLPPSAHPEGDRGHPPASSDVLSRPKRWGAIAAAAAALAIGLSLWDPAGGKESQAPNWKHHADLEEAVHQKQSVKWIGVGGAAQFGSACLLSLGDRDAATTRAVRTALARGDIQKAETILASAQQVPDPAKRAGPIAAKAQPVLSVGMREEILRGDAYFFHLFLFDSCDQDGDVVEVLINGVPFSVVSLTNAGATLSVPISATATTISLRGVRDGTGGITVACRTSEGQGFMRRMAPGEVQQLGVVWK